MKNEVLTNSEEETFRWAKKLGTSARRGSVFALYGDLGAGKTIIAKGIAKGLGIEEDITSPTFILLEIYPNDIPLYHFDLYRIENVDELESLNFEEYWEGEGVSVIEWAERADAILPQNTVRINIEWISSNARRIVIEFTDN